MIKRHKKHEIVELIQQFPAVAILGPRQVGKTTLAQSIAEKFPSIYLDLESPSDLNKLSSPELYLERHEDKLVILDEVQRVPDIFKILRGLIDRGRKKNIRAARFLLLGSASIELLQQSGESLAGRIAYVELEPLSILEIKAKDTDTLWFRGGFPDSYLAQTNDQSNVWRENFIRTYLERDIPMLGPRIPAETLRRFWTMLAHRQNSPFNAAEIARGLAVDGKTIAKYLDLLVDLLLVKKISPWHNNIGKRLIKSAKVYVRDSGLTHSLLSISDPESLLSHPIVGMSWESFVIENLINSSNTQTNPYYYRTNAGAEIDLILELPHHQLWAIEVKRSLSPKIEKGFHNAYQDIAPNRAFVVYPGTERYPIADNVEVIGLAELAALIQAASA